MFSVDDLASWSPELRDVLFALGMALHGRQPAAETIAEIGPKLGQLIPEHVTTVLYDRTRENEGRRRALIRIAIIGPRLNARWNLQKGPLCAMINALCPDFVIRLS